MGGSSAGGRAKFVREYYSSLLIAYITSKQQGTSFDPMKGAPEEQEAYAVSDEQHTGRFDAWRAAHGPACLTPPAPAPAPPVRLPSTVLFDIDQSVLKPEAPDVLAPLLPALRASAHPEVVGYTDATGGRVHNLALSENRARAVAAWFERQDPSLRGKLKARGLGTAAPVGDNATVPGRSQNRRVEVIY